jgi:hypothetical protein
MARRNRGRRVGVFICLGLATIVLAAVSIALATHGSTPCSGLSCPSGGGSATAPAGGSSAWPTITGVAAVVAAVGTLLQGVAAFRKAPAAQTPTPARVQAPRENAR